MSEVCNLMGEGTTLMKTDELCLNWVNVEIGIPSCLLQAMQLELL